MRAVPHVLLSLGFSVLLTACGGAGGGSSEESSSTHSSSVSSQGTSTASSQAVSTTSSQTTSLASSQPSSTVSSQAASVASSQANSTASSVNSSTASESSASSTQSSTQASANRAVENEITQTEWIFCSPQYFDGCTFEGLRDVRFGTGDKWVTKRFLNEMPGYKCNSTEFGSDPAPGEDKQCEYSSTMVTGTIAPPIVCHMGELCPEIDLTAIPIGSTGRGVLRIQDTDDTGTLTGDGTGAFRTICGFSHMAFDDPIVYPGQPGASHLHAFFGNTDTNAYSTADSIANSGNSTCVGGIANRSAYWVPALINTSNGKPIVPDDPIWYYKTGYGGVAAADIEPMPSGLRMIAGSMNATTQQDHAYWDCFETGGSRGASIPNCAVGLHVVMSVVFPQCWDGVNLDSPDHKSHMAYPTGSGCPNSHPHPIPEISLNVKYLVRTENESTQWRLSSDNLELPPGYSAHADWFDGWDPTVRDTWVENCDQAGKDCHAFLLGNGTMLY